MIHAAGPAVRPSARSAASDAGVEDPLDFPPSGSPSYPVLTAGTHLSPDDGTCVMELVSVLAGHRWSDRPACTDPTLAAIARVVNDELSHPVRQHLVPLAVTLVGHLGDRARTAPALVERCLAAAQQHLPTAQPALDRHRCRAARRLAAAHRPRSGRLRAAALAWLYERGPAQHAIAAMAVALRRLPRSERDPALFAVLGAALDLPRLSAARQNDGRRLRGPAFFPASARPRQPPPPLAPRRSVGRPTDMGRGRARSYTRSGGPGRRAPRAAGPGRCAVGGPRTGTAG